MRKPESVIAIHIPDPPPTSRPLNERLIRWGRPELALALQELGHTTVFTNGHNAYDFIEKRAEVLRPQIRQDSEGFHIDTIREIIPLEQIGAIRNMGRVLNHDTPELNQPITRTFSLDKTRLNTIANQLGITKVFSTWSGGDIASAFDAVHGDNLVIKPQKGGRSRDVFVGTKQEISEKINSGEISGDREWIIEEHYSFHGLPVTGYDEVSKAALLAARRQRLPAELRTYYFGRENGRVIKSYIARVAVGQTLSLLEDAWVFLQEDTIPPEVIKQNDSIYNAIASETNVSEMHVALDSTYVSSSQNPDPQWKPMEVNSVPVLLHSGNNAELARDQAHKLAAQLERVAHNGFI